LLFGWGDKDPDRPDRPEEYSIFFPIVEHEGQMANVLDWGDCDFTFDYATYGGGQIDLDDAAPLSAGDIVGIETGDYTDLRIRGFDVSGGDPIHVVNLDGQVVFDDNTAESNIRENKGIWLDGNNETTTAYGFQFNEQRLHVWDNVGEESSDIELNHIHFYVPTRNVIALKVTASTAWTIDNIYIHHCLGRCDNATCLYVGNPQWNTHEGDEEISNVEISYNVIDNAESGIELKGAPSGTNSVHHNTLTDINSSGSAAATGGIHIAQGTIGSFYNNTVIDSEGNLIDSTSDQDGQYIYNNLGVNLGHSDSSNDDGIRTHNNCDTADIRIYNNTIITVGASSAGYCIRIDSNHTGAEVYNNICLDGDGGDIDQGGSPSGNFHDNDTQSEGHTIANYGFVAPGSDNYRLTAGSPGVNAGTNTGAPATDLDDNSRDASCDIGAYEFVGYSVKAMYYFRQRTK
jgi:hypothetical protein